MTCNQPTLWDSPASTCSPASADGSLPCNLPAGLNQCQSGPEAAPVNPSPPREWDSEPQTTGTCGPRCCDSSGSAALQSSLESRLRVLLEGRGAPEYELTWKRWDMPSGPPICALRASARRTFGSVFTGWRQGWATPTARDHKDTGKRLCMFPVNCLLGRQAILSAAPTERSDGSALNPAFTRWLMGFPAAWDSCGATAMQSCRRSRRCSSDR